MPHDDDPKCAKYQDSSGVRNIMSRMLDKNTVPWEWSKCSRHYVTEFLESVYRIVYIYMLIFFYLYIYSREPRVGG